MDQLSDAEFKHWAAAQDRELSRDHRAGKRRTAGTEPGFEPEPEPEPEPKPGFEPEPEPEPVPEPELRGRGKRARGSPGLPTVTSARGEFELTVGRLADSDQARALRRQNCRPPTPAAPTWPPVPGTAAGWRSRPSGTTFPTASCRRAGTTRCPTARSWPTRITD